MQLLLVSVFLVICGSVLVSTSDPHYVIVIPNLLKERSQEKVCVTIQDLDSEFHLKLELQKDDHVQEIATENIKTTDFSHCYSFQVPAVEQDKTEWSFHVSGKGEHFKIDETKKVYIDKGHNACIIQTDKSTYKPGEIVKIRLVSIDHNFHAANEKIEKILLLDPNGNHIGQWLDITPDHGMADLHYHLAKELKLGYYKLNIPNRCEASFTVAEYVSKRFEVLINLPAVPFTAKSFTVEVCASYTYGEPVQGKLDIEICDDEDDHEIHPWYLASCDYIDDDDEHDSEKCIKITQAKTDSKGCLSREIHLNFFNFTADDRRHKLQIESSLTEDGTGHKEEAKTVLLLKNYGKLSFEDTGLLYQKGVPFTGKIKAINTENQPMANAKVVIVSLDSFAENTKLASLETDKDGVAHFTLNTDSWTDEIALVVLLEGYDITSIWEDQGLTHNFLWLNPYFSESKSMLKLETIREPLSCGSDMSVELDYHINKDQLDSKTDHISFFYYIVNDGGIQSHKEHKVDITEQSSGSTLHGSVPLKVHLHADFSPRFIFLIYTILPKGETLSSIANYEVTNCFYNKVELKFSEEKVRPGGKVNLEVSSEAGSLCSVRSVDKGYLLQYPHDDTSFASKVYQSISRPLGQVRYLDEAETQQCPENQTSAFSWRQVMDTSILFQESNLRLITNTHVKMPVKCVEDDVVPRQSTIKKKVHNKGKEGLKLGIPRRNFPDTWLFKLVSVGPEGHTVLNLNTPDTITKWETDAVCLGKSGIGEIRNVGFVTFQPYFIDLILPYSVVQGEKFKIEAHIFSYDRKCILVAVSLFDLDGIHIVQDREQSRCVCDGHTSHFSWDATASKLGEIKIHAVSGSVEIEGEGECKEDAQRVTKDLRMDSIEKKLTVKARGYEEEKTETFLLYVAGDTKKVGIYLKSPDRLVPGTERAHIIVVGDIMANVVVNLENILPLPDGCAEQSVSKLSRYCYSLEYLQSSNELTPETKEKFLEHMIKGYQKQLTFKVDNEGYGFFAGESSNVWITTLVVRAFSCVQQFIHVDEKHIQEAINWLESKQLPSGCLNSTIEYFYHDDDEDDDVKRTALFVISVLEHRLVHTGSIVENALSYLRKQAENTKATDALAILAYAFTLSRDSELRELMLKRLDGLAKKHSGSKHWLHTVYNHGDTETTSYVILALLSDKIITQKDLEESAQSVRWLTSQQNPWGGFYSSQDSTVAIQALAIYAKATGHRKGDSAVIIEDESGFHKELQIDQKNSLLVQSVDLPKVFDPYTVSVTGNGYVYLQSHLHYYIIPDEHDVHFAVNVTTNPAVCTSDAQKKFEVHVEARYIGKRSKTNMALIKVELLSGFVPDRKSIKKLMKHSDVKRVDVLPGEIDIYLEELNHKIDYFVFTIKQETRVDNLQPANVVVLDYYMPELHAHATYNTPCSKAHCSVHTSDRKDCGSPTITKEQCEQKGCCYDTSIPETKWCFFHETKLTEPEADHHSHETQEAH